MADNRHIKQQSSLGPLGQETEYVAQYDPAQLCPIPRSKNWQNQGFQTMPFRGCDIWNAYEISWLNSKGLPRVAVGEFRFPCDSANIIESKSFKLYLNSYNMTRFDSQAQVIATMTKDLSACAGAQVTVVLRSLTEEPCVGVSVERFESTCIDNLDIEIDKYQPAPERLIADADQIVEERLHSHLLKSNCPVTGQPDWASIEIQYQGPKIDHEGLLAYLVSYREQGDFHEDCVEQIFTDILSRCQPEELSVYARYVRRGGLDINPYRSTCYRTETSAQPKNVRLARQ